jgi:hypothetical protein
MSDYRNSQYGYRSDDPLRRDVIYDPNVRPMSATWGWIAAAIFIVVVLAAAFIFGHPGQTGTDTALNVPPAATRMAPPASMKPMVPSPDSPAQRSNP